MLEVTVKVWGIMYMLHVTTSWFCRSVAYQKNVTCVISLIRSLEICENSNRYI